MEGIFLLLYNFFRNKRILFFSIIVIIGLIAIFLASRLRFEEDITKMISGVDKKNEIKKIIEQSGILDRIIINFSLAGATETPVPMELIKYASKLADTLLQSREFQPYVGGITFRISESAMEDVFDIVYRNLPVFLAESDYDAIDTLTTPLKIREP